MAEKERGNKKIHLTKDLQDIIFFQCGLFLALKRWILLLAVNFSFETFSVHSVGSIQFCLFCIHPVFVESGMLETPSCSFAVFTEEYGDQRADRRFSDASNPSI